MPTEAKIIHIEIDRAEIDKNIKSDLAINADAKETLAQIAKKVEYRDRKEWFDFARKENSYEHDKIIAPELASSDYISMGQVVAKISEKNGCRRHSRNGCRTKPDVQRKVFQIQKQ